MIKYYLHLTAKFGKLLYIQMQRTYLRDFLAFLDTQSAESFREGHIDAPLSNFLLDSKTLKPYLFFRPDTYGRNLIAKTLLYEVIALTWHPGQFTPIHDHFGQRCWMFVTQGVLTFKNFKPIESDTSPLVSNGPSDTLHSGKLVYIDDGRGVHSISNCSKEPAASIHLYAGPVPRCRIYDEKEKKFRWVELSYFTEFGRIVAPTAESVHLP